ncbi:hypothetical protein GE09DRAFT_150906 [Coniochaeta sp. 2T2.1]|nr:hypothetical protein GE09DRAFT_150906 [Coniochaeta sp. 2T2.1]
MQTGNFPGRPGQQQTAFIRFGRHATTAFCLLFVSTATASEATPPQLFQSWTSDCLSIFAWNISTTLQPLLGALSYHTSPTPEPTYLVSYIHAHLIINMSFILREAQREHIKHVVRLLITKIRPQLAGAVLKDFGIPYDPDDTRQVAITTIADDGRGAQPEPGLAEDDTTTKTQIPVPVDQDTSSSKIHQYLTEEENKESDRAGEGTTPLSSADATITDTDSVLPLLDRRPADEVSAVNAMTTPITDADPVPLPPGQSPAGSYAYGESLGLLSLDPYLSATFSISLQHLQAGQPLPEGMFEGATFEDVQALDDLCKTLSQMVKSINKSLAAISKAAEEKSTRRQVAGGARSTPATTPRFFLGQEEWHKPGAKKIVWNPEADWGDDAWSEVEVVRQDEANKPAVPSKLRHNYVPSEWWCGNMEASSSEEGEDTWSWGC